MCRPLLTSSSPLCSSFDSDLPIISRSWKIPRRSSRPQVQCGTGLRLPAILEADLPAVCFSWAREGFLQRVGSNLSANLSRVAHLNRGCAARDGCESKYCRLRIRRYTSGRRRAREEHELLCSIYYFAHLGRGRARRREGAGARARASLRALLRAFSPSRVFARAAAAGSGSR